MQQQTLAAPAAAAAAAAVAVDWPPGRLSFSQSASESIGPLVLILLPYSILDVVLYDRTYIVPIR